MAHCSYLFYPLSTDAERTIFFALRSKCHMFNHGVHEICDLNVKWKDVKVRQERNKRPISVEQSDFSQNSTRIKQKLHLSITFFASLWRIALVMTSFCCIVFWNGFYRIKVETHWHGNCSFISVNSCDMCMDSRFLLRIFFKKKKKVDPDFRPYGKTNNTAKTDSLHCLILIKVSVVKGVQNVAKNCCCLTPPVAPVGSVLFLDILLW